ncbi:PD-(D/E)XK nuclease family transposase [Kerstersia gyiorum]|uniref:PD-(D/E)XK nuclease family transposase n=1 Tax=Kerstersia gyiorum TaxID=206506 RepID=UPI0034E1C0ED
MDAVRYRYPPIQVVQLHNPNILPADVSSKQIILDILAKDAYGSFFNVEMQLRHYPPMAAAQSVLSRPHAVRPARHRAGISST